MKVTADARLPAGFIRKSTKPNKRPLKAGVSPLRCSDKSNDVAPTEICTHPDMPDRLIAIIDHPKQAVDIDATYADLKNELLS